MVEFLTGIGSNRSVDLPYLLYGVFESLHIRQNFLCTDRALDLDVAIVKYLSFFVKPSEKQFKKYHGFYPQGQSSRRCVFLGAEFVSTLCLSQCGTYCIPSLLD